MPLFSASRFIPFTVPDFSPIATDVMNHFRGQGYEATSSQLPTGAWNISLSKGDTFKAVLGMKTALSIDIQPSASGTLVTAGVGIFGQQAIPTVISMLFFWPVLIPQIWGLIQQSHLDDEAVSLIEERLAASARAGGGLPQAAALPPQPGHFCSGCGNPLSPDAKFCPNCGAKVA